jgi:ribosomal protein S18 acetylase RimI-like enzyme
MIPYYRPSIMDDVYDLAPRMREADVEEVWATSGVKPLEALLISFINAAECNTIIAPDGEVVGMFGVNPKTTLHAFPWMLCSDRLPEIRKEFIPQSLDWVKDMNEKYPILYNYVDVNNRIAIRWLRYLGFNFIRRIEEFGYGKKPFYEFVRIS